jgi:uncharacterized BrkB/YihY/UPF0761 family membrane protein
MQGAIDIIKYFNSKRFSTISGTLVYFLLMSIAPFLFWLCLVLGDINWQNILYGNTFAAVLPVISYLSANAYRAQRGVSVIFIVTSLYSSTNFFYHLRRSGEIIYNFRPNSGIKLRIVSLAAIAAMAIIISIIFAIFYIVAISFNFFMPQIMSNIIKPLIFSALALMLSVMLNAFACPVRQRFESIISGSLLTTLLWIMFALAFTIYLQFASTTKLYGAIANIILFLLWCYLMTTSLVLGIIYNSYYLTKGQNKKALNGAF